ncbi:MAG TPA: outer membrane protein assembly factor BamA [Pyrinomonadaceae bacterium]|nr:outer membrane protein assembly factor BamA [Pyrinomonadaceae bacterium]
MRIRAPWIYLMAALVGCLMLLDMALPTLSVSAQEPQASPQGQKRVEEVQVIGNRRLRAEDVLYHVQTRAGDVYNPEQVQRDYQALLNLSFFDKTATRVTIQDPGPKGGVVVIFEVKELPVIRDLTFKGLSSVGEADVLKEFREKNIGVYKESTYDPVKVNNAKRVIKELLSEHGHPNATIDANIEEISQTSVGLTFNVDEGERVRVVEIEFTGNQHFSSGELRGAMKLVKEAGLLTRFRGQDILHLDKLDYDLNKNVRDYMTSKGYLEARFGEPKVESLGPKRTGFPVLPIPVLSSTDEGLRVTIPVNEGKLYHLGQIKIEGNSIYSEEVIRQVIGLKAGDVANGDRIRKALYEDLKNLYGRAGFIEYEPEITPDFKPDPQKPDQGIADFTITITEGKQFTLRRLEFHGNTYTRDNVLRREVAVNEGDIFDKSLWEFSVLKLNQLGFFNPIDKDKDAEFRANEETGEVDIDLRVEERGRNQISFNGGLSGIGGSFFGLDYSTNNLLGRGESLSFNVAFGNRQKSILFSFTEPYFKDRPISVGFSLYAQDIQFFGEGTLLSQNANAITGLLGNEQDFLSVGEENLFTQKTTGGSVFATSPLSEFWRPHNRRYVQIARASRIGLSYSLSRSSVEEPAVNSQGNTQTLIPVVFSQPNIITSRITPSFVYDTRNGTIDPTQGTQVALQLALAGLGGDVRTFEPSASYIHFMPIRRKRSRNPEVFGFRLMAGHVESLGLSSNIAAAQNSSLSFIAGVPVYERFFLGDETTIRGYNVRSISPITPLDVFVSSRNVSVSSTPTGDLAPVPVSDRLRQQLVSLGTFTGPSGSNSLLIGQDFRLTGGDTQLLGNFEYRIPVFGPVSLAAYADIGAAFNLTTKDDQTFSTEFLADQPFLGSLGVGGLSELVARRNPQLALEPTSNFFDTSGLPLRGLLVQGDRLLTKEEFAQLTRVGPTDPLTNLPFGVQPVFLRGDAQENTVARISQSLFSKLSDYRSSLGLELRIQMPVVNVPFRLIYAYNPNAQSTFFLEKKSVFRFSIGRTF